MPGLKTKHSLRIEWEDQWWQPLAADIISMRMDRHITPLRRYGAAALQIRQDELTIDLWAGSGLPPLGSQLRVRCSWGEDAWVGTVPFLRHEICSDGSSRVVLYGRFEAS